MFDRREFLRGLVALPATASLNPSGQDAQGPAQTALQVAQTPSLASVQGGPAGALLREKEATFWQAGRDYLRTGATSRQAKTAYFQRLSWHLGNNEIIVSDLRGDYTTAWRAPDQINPFPKVDPSTSIHRCAEWGNLQDSLIGTLRQAGGAWEDARNMLEGAFYDYFRVVLAEGVQLPASVSLEINGRSYYFQRDYHNYRLLTPMFLPPEVTVLV